MGVSKKHITDQKAFWGKRKHHVKTSRHEWLLYLHVSEQVYDDSSHFQRQSDALRARRHCLPVPSRKRAEQSGCRWGCVRSLCESMYAVPPQLQNGQVWQPSLQVGVGGSYSLCVYRVSRWLVVRGCAKEKREVTSVHDNRRNTNKRAKKKKKKSEVETEGGWRNVRIVRQKMFYNLTSSCHSSDCLGEVI